MKTKIQKTVGATLVCLLSIYSGASNGQELETRGSRSCGTWVDLRKENSSVTKASEAWLVGYLSGIVAATGKDALRGTDNSSLFLWMDNYCRSNPLSQLFEGGDKLFIELAKKKGRS